SSSESAEISEVLSETAFQSFASSFDRKNGGFGGAPKFPPPMSLEFLLRYHKRTRDNDALEMVELTARKMAEGGIYDQLGGGFHRYSVDAIWLVPHFEKMLYDNAQLVRIYLHLFQITTKDFYKHIALETLEYIRREMLGKEGGFYSTQDADSEGEEGKFFVWTPSEIEASLGEGDARVFEFFFDVSAEGNFEGANILSINYDRSSAARALKIEENELDAVLERSRAKLFAEREKRIKPFRDEKILTAWNGLMLVAFAEAAAILGRSDYLEIAKKNADFILSNLHRDGRLLRTWKDGKAKLNAYVEDYANVADGFIEVYQISGDRKYISAARRLADTVVAEFWDEENGGFFFTSNDHEELIVRNKDFFDNATPSGNSVAADVLLKLAKFYGEEKYERYATTVLRLAGPQIRRYPQGFGRALSAIEFALGPVQEIALIAEAGSKLEREIWREYWPNKIVARTSESDPEPPPVPLLANRKSVEGKPTVYVCEDFVCGRPATTVDDLARQLN
ncbi:MAG: thioredoxin domain-containing protein, partial [Acidobacteria bacterium]|nr:thioredoxin domain-containing protein [Acidobacteriota bacterium]MCA1607912.1 thioredoxin domain-containing protein [Acidobacteriota bacterium]